MKKIVILFGMLVFVASGCMSYHNSVPSDMTHVKMAVEIETSYKILGPTEGTGEAVRVLWFWVGGPSLNAENCSAVTATGPRGPMAAMMSAFSGAKGKAETAAAYNALENFPGADRIIDAKWKTEVQDYFIYVKAVSTCKGTAVQFSHK